MARRRYFRRPVRVVAAKKKWASNFKSGTVSAIAGADLAVNSLQSSIPTPVILKAGNFKIQGDVTISSSGSGTVSIIVYLAYIPESMSLVGLEDAHPEYVMGWTVVDTPSISAGTLAANKFSITNRLKRNLNSGDRIVLYYKSLSTVADLSVTVSYAAQWFTCAN